MQMKNTLQINASLFIPIAELRFRTSRSSGAGGQNVNRVETRVELVFDLARSPSLSFEQKQRIREVLYSFIDTDGILHLESQETRSQLQNRERVIARFVELLRQALRPIKKRKPTKPTRTSQEKRLRAKKERTEKKEGRRRFETD